MAMIAKNIFSTSVSTVAVEQEFSVGGNILDEQHSCLTPKSLQIQVCVDDWTKAQYRQQEIVRFRNRARGTVRFLQSLQSWKWSSGAGIANVDHDNN